MSDSAPACSSASALQAPLLVACLCAQWCRTCDAYRDTLLAVRAALQSAMPDTPLRFMWIDIEDESELVGDLDIEDFPTLLVAREERVLFFGTVTPHARTLERLVRSTLKDEAGAHAQAPDVLALPARLRAHAEL